MARTIKIWKIDFNMHIAKAGEPQAVKFESFELGDEVDSIVEMRNTDKWYCRVFLKDGTAQDIFNVDRVYWVEEG